MTRASVERHSTPSALPPLEAAGLRIAAARTLPALEALAPAWAALWRRVPDATPFQHPAWLIPWWRAFAHGELWVLALHRGGRLAGVLPLYRELDGKLLPLGIGVTDWLDPLVEEELPLAPVIAALPSLTGCGRVEFPGLSDWSRLRAMPAPPGAREEGGVEDVCPTLPLSAGAAGLEDAIPPKQVRNLRHTRSRALRAGALEVEAATAETAPALLEELFRLHALRWEERGEPGVLADPAVRAFHRDTVTALAGAGLLRMYGLRIGGRIAAVHYGLGDGRCAYYYLGGFDPELAPLGPGVLAVGHAIAEALREGAREFDFLRGREAYKYKWGALDRPSWARRFSLDIEP
ncbi:GNAT family N-acetyltransferase [Azospirillum sp. SYSU D00513]|uniref:GNAT family N-acetyltransferase n=1 Tax=Azospirillum sp. SYSU D00513 TaxID=2812561 RepID=UPI001A95BA9E|nr:GNAT family N-acetyltransferase [Azospirillum sp. SYSU D00513]